MKGKEYRRKRISKIFGGKLSDKKKEDIDKEKEKNKKRLGEIEDSIREKEQLIKNIQDNILNNMVSIDNLEQEQNILKKSEIVKDIEKNIEDLKKEKEEILKKMKKKETKKDKIKRQKKEEEKLNIKNLEKKLIEENDKDFTEIIKKIKKIKSEIKNKTSSLLSAEIEEENRDKYVFDGMKEKDKQKFIEARKNNRETVINNKSLIEKLNKALEKAKNEKEKFLREEIERRKALKRKSLIKNFFKKTIRSNSFSRSKKQNKEQQKSRKRSKSLSRYLKSSDSKSGDLEVMGKTNQTGDCNSQSKQSQSRSTF
jgi:hypothetical protein